MTRPLLRFSIRAPISILVVALIAAAAPPARAQLRSMVVETTKVEGRIKPLTGVNGAPDVRFLDPRSITPPRPPDVSVGYKAAGVTLIRLHDSYGADLNMLFPNLAANPTDPASYNFKPTDTLVQSIRSIGAEVIFRLGRDKNTAAPAPKDVAKYAEIIQHIVLHYNRGWANGFQNTVKYWEIWNEPDLGRIWWSGTPPEYFAFYSAASKAVKAADPQAMVGGPTIAMVNEITPYREGFLDYVQTENLPLDFYSWHWYSTDADDPYDFARIAPAMRDMLDRRGFKRTLNVLDEWNSDSRSARAPDPMQLATFLTSARIYMQDAPIDLDAYHRADGEFGEDGNTPTPIGWALLATGQMAETPHRLKLSGADTFGFAAMAGRSEDGSTVRILISNYEIAAAKRGPRPGGDVLKEANQFEMKLLPRQAVKYENNRGYDLQIKGLKSRQDYQLERFRLTAEQGLKLVARMRARGPTILLNAELPPPGVDMIVLRPAE